MEGKERKSEALTPVQKPSLSVRANEQMLSAQTIAEVTDKQIKEGLEKPNASTGTPMDDLSGGAKVMAQLANIGKGSIETGGEGVKGGLNALMANMLAKGAMSVELQQKEGAPRAIGDVGQK